MTCRTALAALLPLVLLGCREDPTEVSFYENVGSAFDQCKPGEIKFLAAKHNFMLAFEPCGSNNFSDLAWSPAGTHLYFQLPSSHHIMHADVATKNTISVPTDRPVADAAWLDPNRLAVPVAPAIDGGPTRIQVFDRAQMTVRPYDVSGVTDLRDLSGTPDALYFTATVDGARQILRMATDDGSVSSPFEWTGSLTGSIDSFTYTPSADAVVISSADRATLYNAATGEVRGSWPRASRGTMQPRGEWLALEYAGDPISLFYQRAWDELPERARERERRRAEAFEKSLPPWYPTEIRPPRISMVNLANGERWDFTGFYGDHFEWYAADDNYVSFVLWGFEGKQMNTNILLGSLADRLRAIEEGEEMFGLGKWRDENTPPLIDPPRIDDPAPAAAPAPTDDAEAPSPTEDAAP